MLRRGEEPVLIDFQGLRPGNPGYDLASLLWDPYVTFPAGAQEALLAGYRAAAGARGDEAAFRRTFLAAAAQRLMQALGAYGFLGLVRGKPHFLAHIPRALENLSAVTAQAGDLPRLHALALSCRRALAEGPPGPAPQPPDRGAGAPLSEPARRPEPALPPGGGAAGAESGRFLRPRPGKTNGRTGR
jgi:hypothetical protein